MRDVCTLLERLDLSTERLPRATWKTLIKAEQVQLQCIGFVARLTARRSDPDAGTDGRSDLLQLKQHN
jgi:hypothetical protein